jgi:DNA-binding response OmpR family regulator
MRLLIIEDDADIAANLYDFLENLSHVVDAATNGVMGFQLATTQHWDAILLDVTLPGINGLELCQKLRDEAQQDTPILMLTARDTLEDKVRGFSCGADDYLVKPYALREVEMRLIALHKRHHGKVAESIRRVGKIVLDMKSLTVELDGKAVKLPPKCLRILDLLMQHPNKVFSRVNIESVLWGELQEDSDRLRTHMYALRRILAEHGMKDAIKTVHGLGYKLIEPNAY